MTSAEFWSHLRFLLIGTFPKDILGGLAINILLALITMATGFGLGLLLALGRLSPRRLLSRLCTLLIEFVRSLPLVLILFWFCFLVPLFAGRPMPVLLSGVIAISLYSAVNQAEILRGGIMNVDKGQWQAAVSTGLSRGQTLWHVVLPQTLRMVLPSLAGFFLSLFKDTSVITIVGVIDMTRAGLMISQREPRKLFFAYAMMALLFFLCCFVLSRLARKLEKHQQKAGS